MLVGVEDRVQSVAQLAQRFRVELGGELAELGSHVTGQAVQDALARDAVSQPVEDAPSVGPEDVARHAPQVEAGAVEQLLDGLCLHLMSDHCSYS